MQLLHFVWLVVVDLVVSTVQVAWEILTPTDYTDEAIIAVDTDIESRSHFLMLVVAITVTPGTAVIDSDADTGRLYLHVLHAEKAPEIEQHVRHLAELACRATAGQRGGCIMIADIAVGIFLLAGILAGIRLVRGPSLADRVISLDAALVALMGAIGTRVAETGDTLYIGVLVVIAIVAFTATVALSRFIETTGRP